MSQTIAQRLALAEFLKKRFESLRKEELNPEAQADMVVGERHAAKFAGRVAGWVSMPAPATRVSSKERLLAWCKKNLPDEVEEITVERVRPGSERALLDMVKQRGGWVNDAGEIVPVDGIETGDPSPRVELNDDAEAVLAAAWRDGVIDFAGMLALGAAPEPPGDAVMSPEAA
jgi:hypothetical protein